MHFLAALGVAVGSWLSAYFILVTNAFMQHPVGHAVDGRRHARHSATSARTCSNEWALSSSRTTRPRRSSPARSP